MPWSVSDRTDSAPSSDMLKSGCRGRKIVKGMAVVLRPLGFRWIMDLGNFGIWKHRLFGDRGHELQKGAESVVIKHQLTGETRIHESLYILSIGHHISPSVSLTTPWARHSGCLVYRPPNFVELISEYTGIGGRVTFMSQNPGSSPGEILTIDNNLW